MGCSSSVPNTCAKRFVCVLPVAGRDAHAASILHIHNKDRTMNPNNMPYQLNTASILSLLLARAAERECEQAISDTTRAVNAPVAPNVAR